MGICFKLFKSVANRTIAQLVMVGTVDYHDFSSKNFGYCKMALSIFPGAKPMYSLIKWMTSNSWVLELDCWSAPRELPYQPLFGQYFA